MEKETSIFDTNDQHNHVAGKIVVGLERVSEAFRTLLWEHSKRTGLSPIQIQILIFIHYHDDALCGVSHLAKEFNMAKPTISDAVKSLVQKNLVQKEKSPVDSRSQIITLTNEGLEKVSSIKNFALPIVDKVEQLDELEQLHLFDSLIKIIYKLNLAGVINVQRTCFGCTFYEKTEKGHYCGLMQTPLSGSEIRLDCPEFKSKGA